MMETSFDIERAMFGKAAGVGPANRPVFVCGLARAGTSLVTRLLDCSGVFGSLRYRDMPFPLAPNLWGRLSGGDQRRVALAERFHGDGLLHDLDTPEAMEEVYWRCFEGDRYIQSDGLLPKPPRAETMNGYQRLIQLVCLRNESNRYLAKNNNHVLRLESLADTFPDAIFIHPFRHPMKQAASLLAQHRRACGHQIRDTFAGSYAGWLAHHEFGIDQRPHLLPGTPGADEDRFVLEYWLKCWKSVYGFLLEQGVAVSNKQLFIDYDDLCRRPSEVLTNLADKVGCGLLNSAAIKAAGHATETSQDFPIYSALKSRAVS